MQARVRLHVPLHMLEDDSAQLPHFYRRLLAALEGQGAHTEIVHRDRVRLAQGPTGDHFDFVHSGWAGRAQSLNLAVAYLLPFHYVDPMGVYHESSLATSAFWPNRIPQDRAAAFAARLRETLVIPRRSRHPQPEGAAPFPGGHIAIFLQDVSDPVIRAQHMPALEMVKTVLSDPKGHPVVLKPHPRSQGIETQKILDWLTRKHPEVQITDANIHDILKGAAVTVSISSSVAVEGMLHRVPAILFGRSDLHHCAVTVQRKQDWPAALNTALRRNWPYEAFLLWFLRWRNIDASRPFLRRVLERMVAQGADFGRLGIDPLVDEAAD